MKRLFAILLAGAWLFTLLGCQASNPGSVKGKPVELSVQIGQTYSNYYGIDVQITNGFWRENGFVLEVDWINDTSYEAIFGASYTIERKEGQEWVSCATMDDLVFNALAYILSPDQTREETYEVSEMFDVSKPGIYRFHSFCSVEDREDTELWAEFTLCEDVNEAQIKAQAVEEFGVHYIRTNGYQDGAKFPRVVVIKSVIELNDYYNANNEIFDLERKEKVYSDTTIGFLDVYDHYNEAFFEKNYLIFVLLEEGSGSIRHEVRSIQQTADKKISISIDRKVPEVGTSDMAEWHIILELSRDVLVESSIDTYLYVDGLPSYMDDKVVVPQTEGAYQKPPVGKIITPEGEIALHTGGYDWTCALGNGLENTTIADQAVRPLPKDTLTPEVISSQFAETVYAPVPGSDAYAPTNSLGYLVKLQWEANPTSVTYICWPETVWEKGNVPEEKVVSQDGAFYAKPGSYVYEIVATWEDAGKGYHGSVNYYAYIVGGDHSHQVAATAQTVDDPVTGYCGNTQTTLYIGDKEYSFMYGYSVTLTDILVNLNYDPTRICRCRPEYTVDTEFGNGYGINLTAGYAFVELPVQELTAPERTGFTVVEWGGTEAR